MESAIRLVLLEALSEAAAQITCELAPGSVEVRLRGGEPSFAVEADHAVGLPVLAGNSAADDGGRTWRVTLRLPESPRPRINEAARTEGLSINAWLLRATSAALGDVPKPAGRPRFVGGNP